MCHRFFTDCHNNHVTEFFFELRVSGIRNRNIHISFSREGIFEKEDTGRGKLETCILPMHGREGYGSICNV